jgi:outer membrane protein assembly factor BamB
VKNLSRYSLINLPIIFVLLINCTKIKINFDLREKFDLPNWEMYGGDPARINVSHSDISLPLDLKWRYNASSAVGKTILVIDGIAYFNTMDGKLYALDIKTGKKIGHRKINVDGTCAYQDTNIFIALRYGDETLFKYNLKRAKNDWKIDAGDISSEPLLLNDEIAITALYQHIDLYKTSDGSKIWQTKTDGQIRSSPAYHNGIIVFGCDDGFIYAVGKTSGQLRWKFKTNAGVQATPAIKDTIVYIGSSDKTFYAIGIKSGKLIWSFNAKGQILNTPAIDDNVVLFGSTDAHLYCLDRLSGKKIWSFEAKSVISTSPLICKNKVFFGSLDQNYYAVDLKTGEEIWSYKTKGRVKTAPVIWGNYLVGASENNYVYIFSTPEEK